jgi:PhzF family phenazine biosynthesis protein
VPIPIFLVDAFTKVPFSGNPAGVCLMSSWPKDAWMQAVAAEVNASETAFVVPEGNAHGLRWFTPVAEVPLCGHATLATSHVLFESGRARDGEPLAFRTLSGQLEAVRAPAGIELDFPAIPVRQCDAPEGMVSALGATPAFVGRTAPPRAMGELTYLCELADEQAVRNLKPDVELLRRVPGHVIVTARGSGSYAIVSRFFAPTIGLDEDPVTGLAHCSLAPYWAPRLGQARFLAWQASARGGEMTVTLRADRVGLAGQAVTIWSGECHV